MMRLTTLLIISFFVAIAGPVRFFVFEWPESDVAQHLWIYAPAALWFMLFVTALFIHGKRGLWLLVGAPFALFGPYLWTSILLFGVRF